MGPNMYFYEKAQQAHFQDLLREAEKERLLAQLPRHRRSMSRYAAGKPGVLLLKLGTWLKQFEQSHIDVFAHQVRLVRGRFGTYEPIDFLALLIGYAISGERRLPNVDHPCEDAIRTLFQQHSDASGWTSESIGGLWDRKAPPKHSSLMSMRRAKPHANWRCPILSHFHPLLRHTVSSRFRHENHPHRSGLRSKMTPAYAGARCW